MAFFDFNSLSFFALPLTGRRQWGEDTWEVFFPRVFEFLPGQLCALHGGDSTQARLYSLASGNKEDYLSILFKLVPLGFLTPKLLTSELGTIFYVSPPFGDFVLGKERAVWIATGTGIAPFLSAVQSSLELSNKVLIQGARRVEDFLGYHRFKERLSQYVPCCSSAQQNLRSPYYRGRLTSYLREATHLDLLANYYLCGSSQMIVEVREILVCKGVDLRRIICEVYF